MVSPLAPHPNVRIAEQLWIATSRGDVGVVRDLIAPDVVWHAYSAGDFTGEAHGVEEVLQILARSGELVDDLQSDLIEIYGAPSGAVIHYRVEAVRGPVRAVNELLLVLRVEAGRVVHALLVPVDADSNRAFWSTH